MFLSFSFLVAGIGGALANKARISDYVYVHAATDPVQGRCTFRSFGYTTVDNGQVAITLSASSSTTNSNCPVISIYFNQ